MIEIGQDALGRWAWMLFTASGWLIESGQMLDSAEAAVMASGQAFAEAKERGEPDLPTRPQFSFPDAA